MKDRVPTSVLSIVEANQEKGEKLTTLTCRMTGSFKPFTEAVIFPGERRFQVRDIIESGELYKVKVKGISFKECKPFSIITPVDLKIRYNKTAYFIPKDFHSKDFYAGDYYITGGVFSGYRMFKKNKFHAKVRKTGNLYSVDFPFKTPLVPGAEYYFENSSGFKGEMVLIYPGTMGKKGENIVSSRIDKFRSRPGIKGIYSIILRTDNYVDLPYFLADEDFDGAVRLGTKRVMDREYNSVKSKILKQSRASGGVLFSSVKKKSGVIPAFFHAVLDQLISEGEVFIDGDYIVNNSEERADFLSPLSKKCYEMIIESGSTGLSRRSIKDFGMINCFYEVKRMKLAVALDDDLYFSNDSFKTVLKSVFGGKKLEDLLTIQEVRDVTGLSRRYIIDLFNYLEFEGYIERDEDDERTIKKLP